MNNCSPDLDRMRDVKREADDQVRKLRVERGTSWFNEMGFKISYEIGAGLILNPF